MLGKNLKRSLKSQEKRKEGYNNMKVKSKIVQNGVLFHIIINDIHYGYLLPDIDYINIIMDIHAKTDKTPTDIIDTAIEILRTDGCQYSLPFARKLGITPEEFIICKQIEPKANTMLKMMKYGNRFITFIRGIWEDENGNKQPSSSPRPVHTKTLYELPLIGK